MHHQYNAPTIGINAVIPITGPIIFAYGNFKITMPNVQRTPNIMASLHCPIYSLKMSHLLFLKFHTIFLFCFPS